MSGSSEVEPGPSHLAVILCGKPADWRGVQNVSDGKHAPVLAIGWGGSASG